MGAHLHVDMESLDTRESITELVLELLSDPEFHDGPPAGIVLQGYLTDSEDQLDRLLVWSREQPRAVPFTIRLVKGAYWDHEVVLAAQHGWESPVFTDRRSCDRHYEHLTRRLLDARAEGVGLRPAIASHNLRSLAHALAYSERLGLPPQALELQVLRGQGGDAAAAIAAVGQSRARCTARSATSWRGWRTSSAGCSRTPQTIRSWAPSRPAPHSTCYWRGRDHGEHLPQ